MKTYQIPKTAIKMQAICSKNLSRKTIGHVRFDHGMAMATDGHKLIVHKITDDAETPQGQSWKFTGKQPKGNADFHTFNVIDNLAYDKGSNAGGDATIDQEILVFPSIQQVLPKDLKGKIYLSINAKYLYELAKIMDNNCEVTLAIGKEEDGVLVKGIGSRDTLGLVMPVRTGEHWDDTAKVNMTETLGCIHEQFKSTS